MIDEWIHRPAQAITRTSVETVLDRTVDNHRVTIAVVFPVVGACALIASAEGWLPPILTFNVLLLLGGVFVMRSPLVVGLLPAVTRNMLVGLAILAGYTYLIELIGVHTGWPYGAFFYGVELGPMVAGIPVALPLLFIPLVINAYLLWLVLLEDRFESSPAVVGLVIPTVLLMDIILDPAAVALGFWTFESAGRFYGVPLSNYLGWILSGTIAVVIVHVSFDRDALRDRIVHCRYLLDDLISFIILWTLINAWFGHTIPVLAGLVLAMALGYGIRTSG